MQYDDLDNLMARAYAEPDGMSCSRLWLQAAQRAEQLGEQEKMILCYCHLCRAYCFGGEKHRVAEVFSQIWQFYRESPALFNDEARDTLAWNFKLMFSYCVDNPTTSVAEGLALLDEMRHFYETLGDSLGAYYIRYGIFHRHLGNKEQAEEGYRLWQQAKKSELSDCSACEPGYEIHYWDDLEDWAEVVQAGERWRQDKKQDSCDEQPNEILSTLMRAYAYMGRDDEAWQFHVQAYRSYRYVPTKLEELPYHLTYLALSGRAGRPQRLQRGLEILVRHIAWWEDGWDADTILRLATATTLLLQSLPAEQQNAILPITLHGERLGWGSQGTLSQPTIADAIQWFSALAHELAALFDARPGHPHPGRHSMKLAHRLNPAPFPTVNNQPMVEDISGMFGADNQDYAIAPATDTDGIVPIALHGDWQTLTPVECLQREMENGTGVNSIYGRQLTEYLCRHPSAQQDPLSAEAAERYRYYQARADYLGNNRAEVRHYAAKINDKAYSVVIQAHLSLQNKHYLEAAQQADSAMRMESIEPIGVRLAALPILAASAWYAGYPDEALNSQRQLVNLLAALGLVHERASAGLQLANYLSERERYLEAAEAAQNALDSIRGSTSCCGLQAAIQKTLADALTALKCYLPAMQAYLDVADALTDEASQIQHLQSAIDAAKNAELFSAQLYEIYERLLVLLRKQFEQQPEKKTVKMLHGALWSYAKSLVLQPGQVPDSDKNRMIACMEEAKSLFCHPDYQDCFSYTMAWQQADWLDDMAQMHYWCYDYPQAEQYAQQAIEQFRQLNELSDQANAMITLARIYEKEKKTTRAAEQANKVLWLLSDAKYSTDKSIKKAREILKSIGRAEEKEPVAAIWLDTGAWNKGLN